MEPVVGTPEPDYSGFGTRQQMRAEIVRLQEQLEMLRVVVQTAYHYYPKDTPMSDSMRDALE